MKANSSNSITTARIQMAHLHTHEDNIAEDHQCISILNQIIIIPSHHISYHLSVIHDCYGGKCSVKALPTATRLEQSDIEVNMKKVKHNSEHNHYFINPFKI